MSFTYWPAFFGGPPRFGDSLLLFCVRPLTKSDIQVASFLAALWPEVSAAASSRAARGAISLPKSSLPIRTRRMSSGMQLNAITAL